VIESVTTTITTDASGDATVYLGSRLRGKVLAIKYEPGSLYFRADLTITGETTEVPILIVSDGGTSDVWFFPRRLASDHADESTSADDYRDIYVLNERIKVVVANAGDEDTGTITIYIDTPD
jgi:hypothetical protein